MSGSRFETFDVSEKARKIIEWRHARRIALRHEYLKESLKPIKQKLITDGALERYTSVRLLMEFHVKVTARGVGLYALGLITTIVAGTAICVILKDNEEHLYRTGQVSYADRTGKFC
ncbi:hypothetical protein ANTQUA_LOCUS8354 [Anthophora quadrimaculata]